MTMASIRAKSSPNSANSSLQHAHLTLNNRLVITRFHFKPGYTETNVYRPSLEEFMDTAYVEPVKEPKLVRALKETYNYKLGEIAK